MALLCPTCGTDGQIQNVSVIYAAGTQLSGFSGNTANTGPYNGSVQSQSLLAKRLAPPSEPYDWPTLWRGIAIVFLIIAGPIFIVEFMAKEDLHVLLSRFSLPLTEVVLLGLMIRSIFTRKIAMSKHAPLVSKWRNLWFCYRCGNTFN